MFNEQLKLVNKEMLSYTLPESLVFFNPTLDKVIFEIKEEGISTDKYVSILVKGNRYYYFDIILDSEIITQIEKAVFNFKASLQLEKDNYV